MNIQTWIISILLIAILSLGGWSFYLKKDNEYLNKDLLYEKSNNLTLETKLNQQNESIEKMKVDYEAYKAEFQKKKEELVSKYSLVEKNAKMTPQNCENQLNAIKKMLDIFYEQKK